MLLKELLFVKKQERDDNFICFWMIYRVLKALHYFRFDTSQKIALCFIDKLT